MMKYINRRDLLKGSATVVASGVMAPAIASGTLNPHPEVSVLSKPIPSSGELVPVVGIGTNRYRGGPEEETRAPLRNTLRAFAELGGRFIDTAPSYGNSEAVLGELIAELGGDTNYLLATKCDTSGGKETQEQMGQSARLLGAKTLDFMQIHNLRNWQQQLPVMREWKAEGHIRYCGITIWKGHQFDACAEVLRVEPLDTVQLNYSLLDRAAETELLPLAQEKGVAVIANVPFARGRLFDAVKGLDLPEWAAEFDCYSWAQFFLKYVVSHPAVTLAIPGTTKEKYARDNFGAARGVLPDAAMRKRQEAFIDNL